MIRMNLTVEDDVPAKLAELAGGDRKRGDYLSHVVRQLYTGHLETTKGDDLESLRLTQAGLAGRVKDLDVRLSAVERQLAAVIAAKP
jgi:hypothetical protein